MNLIFLEAGIFYYLFAGYGDGNKPIYLRDVWPLRSEIHEVEQKFVIPAMFNEVYSKIEEGSPSWASLDAPSGQLYPWDNSSTYIKKPPFFEGMTKVSVNSLPFDQARDKLTYGNFVNTNYDHFVSFVGKFWYTYSFDQILHLLQSVDNYFRGEQCVNDVSMCKPHWRD